MLTAAILRAAFPAARPTDHDRFAAPLAAACAEWGIDTPLRLAAFLAQIAHESGQLRNMAENLNYSAEALLRVFPRHFDAAGAEAYARQPERIAARVYANRMGNGDEASGDGWRYRGRGLIQIEDRQAVQAALIAQSGASISAARADVVRAKADFERTQRLVKDDFVSRQRFDVTAADAAKAQASLNGSGAGLQAAQRQVAVLASEKVMIQAQMEQAKAALTLADSDLDATVVRAPVDGVVGNRAVRDGQYVRPGQTLMAVVPLQTAWIDANFKETQLARIRPGQRVEIKVDAFGGQVIEGRVDSFAPATGSKFSLLPAENATGNFTKVVQRVPVRIVPTAGHALHGALRPGLSVVVSVDTRAP